MPEQVRHDSKKKDRFHLNVTPDLFRGHLTRIKGPWGGSFCGGLA